MVVRIGVIGAGVMGAEHARLLQHVIAGAAVTRVADLDADRAASTASKLGAQASDSAGALVASPDVDAVVIASPDGAHADQVLACLAHAKPVLCEKPLAPTSAECRRVVAAEDALGREVPLVSVGFMRRFHPALAELKASVDSGVLGAPLLVKGSHRNVESYPGGRSSDTITNSAIHDIDCTSWLLGSPVVEVSWHAPKPTSQDTSRHDPQLLHLRTADGVLASIDVFVNARYGYDVRYEVLGELGSAQLAPAPRVTVDRSLQSTSAYPADWRPFFADAYRIELQAWVDALLTTGVSPLASARDGLQATLVAEALITSMHEEGRTVRVEAVGDPGSA